MLSFIEIQLRRDEYILKNYKKKYELVNPTQIQKIDFFKFYDRAIILKNTMLTIEKYQKEKMVYHVKNEFSNILINMSSILTNIYTFMHEGDQMKKLEAYLITLEDGEITEDEEVYIDVRNLN